MRSVLLGAGAGIGCPLALVAVIWAIQFVTMVGEPGPDGPNWVGWAVMAGWTLLFASPFLILGGVIGATVGGIVGAVVRLKGRPE